jgi:hypothetical protein
MVHGQDDEEGQAQLESKTPAPRLARLIGVATM